MARFFVDEVHWIKNKQVCISSGMAYSVYPRTEAVRTRQAEDMFQKSVNILSKRKCMIQLNFFIHICQVVGTKGEDGRTGARLREQD